MIRKPVLWLLTVSQHESSDIRALLSTQYCVLLLPVRLYIKPELVTAAVVSVETGLPWSCYSSKLINLYQVV